MSAPQPPDDRLGRGHADAAADHILALVVAQDATLRVTPELHDATAAIVRSVAAALAAVGAR